ncbi:MAG: hypothetical protein LBH22_07590 [Bacteroidales bacterium]|jgi:DNA primase catalytic subunit|nr:hypothetical protein [Bacteroidales bacterium]
MEKFQKSKIEAYVEDFYQSNDMPIPNVWFPNEEERQMFYVDNGTEPFVVDLDEFNSWKELDSILRMRTIIIR